MATRQPNLFSPYADTHGGQPELFTGSSVLGLHCDECGAGMVETPSGCLCCPSGCGKLCLEERGSGQWSEPDEPD